MSPEKLQEEVKEGRVIFLVAEVLSGEGGKSGEIAGMLAVKDGEGYCELASEIIRKKYRGYGIAIAFANYGIEVAKAKGYPSICGLSAFFHDITQRLLYHLGFVSTGFALGILDMESISYSYEKGCNLKSAGGIQVKALKQQHGGTLYLPQEWETLCHNIYDSIGVSYDIGRTRKEPLPEESTIFGKQDMGQSSMEIRIHRIGKELMEHIKKFHRKYPLEGRQTSNIYLNLHDKNAVWAYEKLQEAGYFFAGFHPLCGEQEYMVLHHKGEVTIQYEGYVISEAFTELAEEILTEKEI